jgi:hypothetical protein
MINAGFQFYLSSLDSLISSFPNSDATDPSERAKWTSKLESWVIKGIEDWELAHNSHKARALDVGVQ